MQNERNEATDVCDDETVNTPILILRTGVWSSHEMFEHHVLNICCSLNL